jgi:hypothetical protein
MLSERAGELVDESADVVEYLSLGVFDHLGFFSLAASAFERQRTAT